MADQMLRGTIIALPYNGLAQPVLELAFVFPGHEMSFLKLS